MTQISVNAFSQITPCRVVATSNVAGTYSNGPLNNGIAATLTIAASSLTIDSILLSVNNRVLLTAQTSAFQNGVYFVLSISGLAVVLQRANDQQSIEQFKTGQFIPIAAGTDNAGSIYILVEPFPLILGTSALTYLSTWAAAIELPTIANSVAIFTNTQGNLQGVTTLPSGLTIPQPNIIGVTNGSSAPAGSVGEVLSVSLSSQINVLSNNTAKDFIPMNITAGGWLVFGNLGITVAAATTLIQGWINSTSATAPLDAFINSELPFSTAAGNISFNVPTQTFNVPTTTTIYLSGLATFSGTAAIMNSGTLYAVRLR